MTAKPPTRDGYSGDQLDLVTRACLYVFTKLGDLCDEVVVVGGLVPYLLVDQDDPPTLLGSHSGTMDLDLGLALAILDEQRYQDLSARLRSAGFSPDVNSAGNAVLQRWVTNSGPHVTIDFLIPPQAGNGQPGRLFHIENDFAAILTEGLDLAFRDRRSVTLSSYTLAEERATRDIPVCGPGAFTVLKALAFRNRGENKDAYDLHYVLSGLGAGAVAQSLTPLLPDERVQRALDIIRADFTEHDAIGPRRVAQFLPYGLDDEVQADVVGQALALLRELEMLEG